MHHHPCPHTSSSSPVILLRLAFRRRPAVDRPTVDRPPRPTPSPPLDPGLPVVVVPCDNDPGKTSAYATPREGLPTRRALRVEPSLAINLSVFGGAMVLRLVFLCGWGVLVYSCIQHMTQMPLHT